jgi:FdhE protein
VIEQAIDRRNEIAQAVARLDQLALHDTTAAPLARLQAEVLRAMAAGGWDSGVPDVDQRQAEPGMPLLHRQMLRADRGKLRQLLGRLTNVVAKPSEPAAAGARAIGRAATDGRLDLAALLQASVVHDGDALARLADVIDTEPGLLATLGHLVTLPLLQAYGHRAAPLVENLGWEAGSCPVCAAWPTLSELRGLERTRWLRCGRCGSGWSATHLGCPYCGNADRRSQSYLAPERQRESRRAVTCEACGGYLKALTTLGPMPAAEIGLMDAQTLELDMAALEEGYGRPDGLGFPMEVTVELTESRSRWLPWR